MEVLKLFLEAADERAIQKADCQGCTALHIAAMPFRHVMSQAAAVALLLPVCGGALNATDNEGEGRV